MESLMYTREGTLDEVEIERHGMLTRIASFTKTQSEAGYRLLLVGGRYVTDAEYEVWLKELLKAEKAMKNREESIERAFVGIEHNMSILGATSVEDELQDHIREDIQFLREGGITMAMATGDKKETAVIIARNCGLYTDDMRAFDLTGAKETVLLHLENVMTHAGYREHLKRVEYEKKNGGWLRRLMGCYSRRPSCCPTAPPSPQPYLLILDGCRWTC